MKKESFDLKSMTLEEINTVIAAMGEKPFRAKQLYEWMHVKLARNYDEMTNLPKGLRERLTEHYPYTCLREVMVQKSKLDGTQKYLLHWRMEIVLRVSGCSTIMEILCASPRRSGAVWGAGSVPRRLTD